MINIPGPALLDLNTQRDLFTPEGVMPLHQVAKFAEPLRRLFNAAGRLHTPIISTRFCHQMAPQARGGLPRLVCLPGTPGYEKLAYTTLRRRTEMPPDCGTSLPVEGFHRVHQYVFDLPSLNLFECPRLDRLLSESSVGEYIIIGAPLEWTVRTTVLGLLQRRQKVSLIAECIGQWDPYEGDMALRQVESKNVEWLTVEQAIERLSSKPKPVRMFERRPGVAQLNTPHALPTASPAAARTGAKKLPKAPAGKFRA